MKKELLLYIIMIFLVNFSFSQEESIARKWNEVLLNSIRNDLARPTVHARNLFHISAAMDFQTTHIHKTGNVLDAIKASPGLS